MGLEEIDSQTEVWMDKQISPCVQQDFVPFEAAALLYLTPIHNHAKQGKGYRLPHAHIALGNLFFITAARTQFG